MKKESKHSQGYDRKHGNDHNEAYKASLGGEFIEKKSKPSDMKGWNRHVQKSDRDKNLF